MSVEQSAPGPERPSSSIQHQIVSVTDVETADFLTARNIDEKVPDMEEVDHPEQVEQKSGNSEILSP